MICSDATPKNKFLQNNTRKINTKSKSPMFEKSQFLCIDQIEIKFSIQSIFFHKNSVIHSKFTNTSKTNSNSRTKIISYPYPLKNVNFTIAILHQNLILNIIFLNQTLKFYRQFLSPNILVKKEPKNPL